MSEGEQNDDLDLSLKPINLEKSEEDMRLLEEPEKEKAECYGIFHPQFLSEFQVREEPEIQRDFEENSIGKYLEENKEIELKQEQIRQEKKQKKTKKQNKPKNEIIKRKKSGLKSISIRCKELFIKDKNQHLNFKSLQRLIIADLERERNTNLDIQYCLSLNRRLHDCTLVMVGAGFLQKKNKIFCLNDNTRAEDRKKKINEMIKECKNRIEQKKQSLRQGSFIFQTSRTLATAEKMLCESKLVFKKSFFTFIPISNKQRVVLVPFSYSEQIANKSGIAQVKMQLQHIADRPVQAIEYLKSQAQSPSRFEEAQKQQQPEH